MFENVRLPDPDRMLGAYPHEISGGQRQRAMIAMALVLEPKVIIADEPTTALDVTTQAQILQLIKDLQGEHHTGVLYVTHDFGVVAEVADRVAVMQTGRLVEVGGAEQVLNAPSHPYTRSLVRAVPSLVPARRRAIASDESALETRRLNKTFRSGGGLLGGKARLVDAVKDVSLRLLRGETLGVVGESGSGKSTVARLIVRIVAADSGSVLLGGVDVLSLSANRIRPYRKRIQMVFQDPYGSLNPRHKVGRLIAEGMIVHGTGEGGPRTSAPRSCSSWWGSMPTWRNASRTSSPAASASGSESPGRSPSTPRSSSPTSRCRRSTFPCRRRFSICSPGSAIGSD